MAMKTAIAALVAAFTRDIHESVRLELMEEMRAFSAGHQKRAPHQAPVRKKTRKKRRAKRSGGEAQLPRPKARGRAGRAVADPSTGEGKPAVPGESPGPSSFGDEGADADTADGGGLVSSASAPDEPRVPVTMVPVPTPYPVIIRWDGKRYPNVALLVSRSGDGAFFGIRLAQGRNRRYSRKVRRIIAAEFVRDATDREANLGVVPFDAVTAA